MRRWIALILLAGIVLSVTGAACKSSSGTKTATATSTVVAASAATSVPAAPTSTAVAVATATTEPLLQARAANLLTVADLPSGWSMEPSDPGSSIADPSTYSACHYSPVTPLDVGFGTDVIGSFLGETIVSSASISDARAAANAASHRATSCTTMDTSINCCAWSVTSQQLSASYGDEVSAYRATMTAGGSSLGYIVIVRKRNLVAAFFYIDEHGGDGLAVLESAVAAGVGRLGE